MKTLLSVIALAVMLVGCGQTEEAAEPAAPAAPAEVSAPTNDVIVDYVWNTAAPDMTDEQLADIIARWNARIDAGGYDMSANVLKPQFETDDYDLIWVLLWPSSEAREAGWADWNANQVDDWNAELDGALSYQAENVFSFKPVGGWDSNLASVPAGGTFLPNFSFCKLNEGFDDAAFNTFRAEYDVWLAEGSDADYGYYIMEPQFEQDDADVVWLDLFADEAAMQAGTDSWTGSDLAAQWDAMLACENYAFTATAIRR